MQGGCDAAAGLLRLPGCCPLMVAAALHCRPADCAGRPCHCPLAASSCPCAGTIAAVRNNGKGVAGVAPDAKIISAKFMGPSGGTTWNAIRAFDYVIALKKRGVNIVAINNSCEQARSWSAWPVGSTARPAAQARAACVLRTNRGLRPPHL